MDGFASALMLLALICSELARTRDRGDGAALEWLLTAALFAAAALLVWLPLHGTEAALLAWLAHIAAGAVVLMARRAPQAIDRLHRPAWTMGVLALLGAGLVLDVARAQPPPDATEPAAEALGSIAVEPLTAQTDGDATGAAPDSPIALDDVIVHGEKLGRSLAETTSSVGVATREDLSAGSAATMNDIVTQFANIVAAAGDREIAIRGVPQGGIGGEGDTISVYLDGVALPSRAASFAGPLSAWDLEQVEVLRGAQSTNQGRNSLAGSVVLRSREPTPFWDARLRAGISSRGGHDHAFAGGGPLGDTLRFRLAAQDRYDNGDITNVTRDEDDAGREVTRNARAKLAWTPAALPGYRAQYGYTRADNEFGDPLHDSSQGERTETSNVRGNEDDLSDLHSLEQSYAFGSGWHVDSISGWTGIDNLYVVDYDRSAADGGYSDNTIDERIASQELRLHYDGARFKIVVGAYVADTDKATRTVGHDVATAGGLILLDGYIDSDSALRTQALFTEADWDFAAGWRLTAGLRWNQERSHRHDVSDLDLTVNAAIPGVALPDGVELGVPLPDAVGDLLATLLPAYVPPDYDVSDRRRFTDLLPKLGLSWLPTADTTVALTYQEGYRSGGTSVSFFGGAVSPFDPEYTRTLELATRSRWFDRRLTLNTNLFYTRWRDQQVTIGETSGFETLTENAGRSHSFGLDAEALWVLRGPLEAFATLGLLRSEFDAFVNDGEDYAGNAFPYAPEQTAGLGLTLREFRRVTAQIAVHYIGAFYSDPDNDPQSRADARTLLNARIGYRLPAGFSISVYGRNLTDDPNLQGALVSGSRIAARYGEPRTFGTVLEWQL
jgi:iron complex outermembrane receptor protein